MKGVLLMSNNESIKAIFKDNLNKLLIEKDVTQKALADFVGVSTATVSDWKKGKKMPLMDKIDKICMFFHVDRSELLSTFDATNSDAVFAYAAGRPSSLHKIPPSRVLHNTGYVRYKFRHDRNPSLSEDEETDISSSIIDKQLEEYVTALMNAYREEIIKSQAKEPESPTITEAEQALLDAYRNAPADKKTIVNLTLGLK
jgi:transcriptional regulator with XRE-family HTH domain